MGKFKLAFLTSHPIQYQTPLFRKLAASRDIELMVYFLSNHGLAGEIDPGFGVSVKWDTPILEGYSYRFIKSHALPRAMSSSRHDAVIVHGYGTMGNWLAFLTARLGNLPIILHGETISHNNRSELFQAAKRHLLRSLFKKIAAFLYIGTRSRKFYESFGILSEKLFFSPYSVDNDFFLEKNCFYKGEKGKLKQKFGIGNSEPVILYVSKLTPRKRPFDALLAFHNLGKNGHLVFVGDGEERNRLEATAKIKSIRNVHFVGFKNQTELPQYYAMADIFLLPSSFEPWGLVVNEAMCFGLPVITTSAVASSADLVHHGESGFIYTPGDISMLSSLLSKLLDSPEQRHAMGEAALKRIAKWSYEQCLEGITNSLHYVAAGKETGKVA